MTVQKSKVKLSIFFVLGICLIMLFPVGGQTQSIVSVLDLGMGVRPLGLGGAFTGLADDENAVLYNTAALAYLDGAKFSALFERRFGVVNHGTVAFAARNLGVGFLFLNIIGLPRREEREALDSFSYANFAAVAAFGMPLNAIPGLAQSVPANIALGLRAKLLRVNTLPEGRGSGLALDPSFLMEFKTLQVGGFTLERLRVGATIDNLLGLGIRYGSGHAESWRLGLRLGASATTAQGFTTALDLDTNGTLHFGSEFRLRGIGLETLGLTGGGLAVRFGSLLGKQFAPTFGLSLTMDKMQIDYAFITHSLLPASHRLSFGMAFDMPPLLKCLNPVPDPCRGSGDSDNP